MTRPALEAVDHLVYATNDVATTTSTLQSQFATRLAYGGSHPGRGTCNYLVGLGGRRYLEVIGPDPDQPDPPERPFGIDLLTEPRLVTWATEVADLDRAIAQASERGYNAGPAFQLTRTRPDGFDLSWRVARGPNGVRDNSVPFLIEWGSTPHPSLGVQHLLLRDIKITHPEPPILSSCLEALGIEAEIDQGPRRLQARIETKEGQAAEL